VEAVPALSQFNTSGPIVAIFGLVLVVVLMMFKVKGAMLISIIASTIVGIPMGITFIPERIFDLSLISGFSEVSFAFFGDIGFVTLFSKGPAMIPIVIITIFAFSITDIFDTIGTFIGTGRKAGIFDEDDEKAIYQKGFKSRMEKALFADSTATFIGSMLGTSNVATYIESAAGIKEGGRTGFTSVIVAALFLLCLPFAALFSIVPAEATAPVLIVVGILMASDFADIRWKELEEAIPAFLTVAVMTFAYNIAYGIAAGFIFYVIVKLCTKKIKEVHPMLIAVTILFLVNFVLLAVNKMGV